MAENRAEIACLVCGHKISVADGERIICPNCKEKEAVKALFSATARPEEVHHTQPDGPQLTFICPFCSETYSVSEELAGKKITCRNCYEPCRVPERKASRETAPEAVPAPSSPPAGPIVKEPWYYGFLEYFATAGMVLGGMACLIGFVVSFAQLKKGEERLTTAFLVAYLLAFLGIVSWMALVRIVVDIGRRIRARPANRIDDLKKQDQ